MTIDSSMYASRAEFIAAMEALTTAYGKPAELAVPAVTRTITVSLDHRDLKSKALQNIPRMVRKGSGHVAVVDRSDPTLPKKGSLSHADFLAALREAGKREAMDPDSHMVIYMSTGEARMVFDPGAEREDQRRAIAGYIGYDSSEVHGHQLDRARMIASRAVAVEQQIQQGTYHPSRHGYRSAEAHSSRWSTFGYIKGLPRPVEKMLLDLGARERTAEEEMICFSKLLDLIGNVESFSSDSERTIAFNGILHRAYPNTDGVEYQNAIHPNGEPILEKTGVLLTKMVDGVVVEEPEYRQMKVPVRVERVHPVKAKILAEWNSHPSDVSGLERLLGLLEATASERLDNIRADIACIDPEKPTPAQIAMAARSMANRGVPIFAESLADLVSIDSKV